MYKRLKYNFLGGLVIQNRKIEEKITSNLHIYEDSFGAKILRDDSALTINCNDKMHMELERMTNIFSFL